jgi:hypothetical protein
VNRAGSGPRRHQGLSMTRQLRSWARSTVGRGLRVIGIQTTPIEPRLVEVPTDRCISLGPLAFACGPASVDPLTRTVIGFADGSCTTFDESPLRTFLHGWQPQQLAETVGVPIADASRFLQAPAVGRLPPLPWDLYAGSTSEVRNSRPGLLEAAQRAGVDGEAIAGIIYHGPVTAAFGHATFERLVSIFESIRADGYLPDGHARSNMIGQVLVSGDDSRVIIRSGKHRVAALNALGYEALPVMLGPRHPSIVDRASPQTWQAVRSGVYTPVQALEVFDRVFAGLQPPGLRSRGVFW